MYYLEAWGAVCGEHWDMADANVVCHMLGYGGASAHSQNITLEQENGTEWLSGVQCIGNESSLAQCAHAGWGKHTCNITQAAGVTCFERPWGEYVLLSIAKEDELVHFVLWINKARVAPACHRIFFW